MELPETLIHLVQSLLNGKEAARTTLLSKSWHAAWSTRPTIDLDQSHHPSNRISIDGLTSFGNKTFRRYEEFNLSIVTFILCLENVSYVRLGLAADWILKALKLGATDLTFRFPYRNIQYRLPNQHIDIPLIDVFGSENIQRLCLQCVNINGLKVIKCTRLKSLTLSHVNIKPHQFFDILSCFPLIEYLSLSDIRGYDDDEQLIIVTRSPPTIFLPRLMSLALSEFSEFESQFQMKTLFLDDLSSKFPNLKHLTLGLNFPDGHYSVPQVEVLPYRPAAEETQNISSVTLETLNLRYEDDREKGEIVELVVPNVRKFTFEGSMPCFSPLPAGDQWDSHVSITNMGNLRTLWFRRLSELLAKLKGSKIHLCIHMHYNIRLDYEVGEIDGVNVLEVEDLTLDTKDLPSLTCYALLDALFRICRPKTITQYVTPPPGNNRCNDVFICRSIERAMQVKSVLLPTQFMYGLRDLEELDAQQFIDGVWRRQPLGSILDDSTSEQRRRFRLQLKWKPSRNQ